MDWYSHWIEKHVLVQIICFDGSYYANLHCCISCIGWASATIISPTNVMMYDHHNLLGNHPELVHFAHWFHSSMGLQLNISTFHLIVA
jgi:hypothetical protein